jgi:hypothetical protein
VVTDGRAQDICYVTATVTHMTMKLITLLSNEQVRIVIMLWAFIWEIAWFGSDASCIDGGTSQFSLAPPGKFRYSTLIEPLLLPSQYSNHQW